jgi:exopolysaccharide biosynthesis protein
MHVLSFGPTLIENGEIALGKNLESRDKKTTPRCAIGMIEPLHYIFVVANGRTDEDRGLTTMELARVFEKYGCTFAYNLDGGGSATMVFMGELINDPRSGKGEAKEREVSDIVFIGTP